MEYSQPYGGYDKGPLADQRRVKHLWQNETVSIYADHEQRGDYWEVEIAIGYQDDDGHYIRLDNAADREEAARLVASALHLFDWS